MRPKSRIDLARAFQYHFDQMSPWSSINLSFFILKETFVVKQRQYEEIGTRVDRMAYNS